MLAARAALLSRYTYSPYFTDISSLQLMLPLLCIHSYSPGSFYFADTGHEYGRGKGGPGKGSPYFMGANRFLKQGGLELDSGGARVFLKPPQFISPQF